MTPNIIHTMKHTVNASVLTISTDSALVRLLMNTTFPSLLLASYSTAQPPRTTRQHALRSAAEGLAGLATGGGFGVSKAPV